MGKVFLYNLSVTCLKTRGTYYVRYGLLMGGGGAYPEWSRLLGENNVDFLKINDLYEMRLF